MTVYTYNSFNEPVAFTGTTQAYGINDPNEIVGPYQDAADVERSGRHQRHAMLRHQ